MFAPRNHQSTSKTAQCSDSNQYQESPVPPTVEDITCYYDERILQPQLMLTLAECVIKYKPIEQKYYWEEDEIFEGVKKHLTN